ncbi:MAG TPA: DUF3293 domain-containing protein [Nitrosospira sp.]|nr:DUF3293 domain-containing protein [Nitrosospira sp.]
MKKSAETPHWGDQRFEQPGFEKQESKIPADVIDAYRSAHYQAGIGRNSVTLRVDHYSESLSRLFSASDHRGAAFITACNPGGVRQRPQENRAACERLRERLNQYVSGPDDIIEGMGLDPSGDWPGEESFLALGLDLEVSRTLGAEFQQNAVLWANADAIPRLILLR